MFRLHYQELKAKEEEIARLKASVGSHGGEPQPQQEQQQQQHQLQQQQQGGATAAGQCQ